MSTNGKATDSIPLDYLTARQLRTCQGLIPKKRSDRFQISAPDRLSIAKSRTVTPIKKTHYD